MDKDILDLAEKWRNFYRDEAERNEKNYHRTQYILIISSIIIPIINVFEIDLIVRIVSAVLGSIIVGVTWLNQLRKFHEYWINSSQAWTTLDHEILAYTQQIEVYDIEEEERDKLFKKNILNIIRIIDTKSEKIKALQPGYLRK